MTRPFSTLVGRSLVVGSLLLLAVAVIWFLTRQPQSRFLPSLGAGEWIVYPCAPNAGIAPMVEQSTVFRRAFRLDAVPERAILKVVAYRKFSVVVNGHPIRFEPTERWQSPVVADVRADLVAGNNELVIDVVNDNGHPALWAELLCGETVLASDSTWESSLVGATPTNAKPASDALEIRSGNPVASNERVFASLRAVWPWLAGFACISAGALAAWKWLRTRAPDGVAPVRIASVGIVIAWAVLLIVNQQSLPRPIGYDVDGHLAYIHHLLDRHSIPLVGENWEAQHPPLYYTVAALALKITGATRGAGSEVIVLRALSFVIGLVNLFFIARCLDHLFPRRTIPQLVGLVFAAAIPLSLYVAHAVSNDLLAATLGVIAVYLTLLVLSDAAPSVSRLLLLGAVLGAGILTKLTCLPGAAAVFIVLAFAVLFRDRSIRTILRNVGLPALVCLLVCGWFFARNYQHYGQFIVGNFDPISGFRWWQDPGYTNAGLMTKFGLSLDRPFYSAYASAPDAFYSTLWGDGLWSGAMQRNRPPWNYDLMAAGYCLALFPSFLIVIGFGETVRRWVRRPDVYRALLLVLPAIALAAVTYQYIRHPYYGSAKAIYAFPALIAICAFAGRGFELLAGHSSTRRRCLAVAFGVWALAAYFSFFINPSGPAALVRLGKMELASTHVAEAGALAEKALASDANNVEARVLLANALIQAGRGGQALEHIQVAAALNPADPDAGLMLAEALVKAGNTKGAIAQLRALLRVSPDCFDAHDALAGLLATDDLRAAILVARDGLRAAPQSPDLHFTLARLLLRDNQTRDAVMHLRQSAALNPNHILAMTALSWVLASHEQEAFRDGAQAVLLARKACEMTGGRDIAPLRALAAAYAETGNFAKATSITGQILALPALRDAKILDQVRVEHEAYQRSAPLRLSSESIGLR